MEIFSRNYSSGMRLSRNLLKLRERGFFQNIFPENSEVQLSRYLESGSPQCIYCGFDPTADSLHIGHLLPVLALLHSQRAGHRTIALIGGASAIVGDPTGRIIERPTASLNEIHYNMPCIERQLASLFSNYRDMFRTPPKYQQHDIQIMNNSQWFTEKKLLDFLVDIGRHFRIGQMLTKHSVKARMESYYGGINFTEFSYQIFQAYDWLHLYKNHDCRIQIGGNDQLGNMTSGYDLIRRVCDAEVFCMTVPLLTSTGGDKLGKTSGNAVWLDGHKTTPFELYQYFINLPDSEVEKYLRLLTVLSSDEIDDVMREQKANPSKRAAQKKVAEQVTLLVHKEDGLKAARQWTRCLISRDVDSLYALNQSDLLLLFNNAPCVDLIEDPEMTLLDMCMKAGCFASKEDGVRVITAGGLRINHQRLLNPDFVVTHDFMLPSHITLMQIGKKSNFYVVRWH